MTVKKATLIKLLVGVLILGAISYFVIQGIPKNENGQPDVPQVKFDSIWLTAGKTIVVALLLVISGGLSPAYFVVFGILFLFGENIWPQFLIAWHWIWYDVTLKWYWNRADGWWGIALGGATLILFGIVCAIIEAYQEKQDWAMVFRDSVKDFGTGLGKLLEGILGGVLRIFVLIVVLLILGGLVLCATNPSESDHRAAIKAKTPMADGALGIMEFVGTSKLTYHDCIVYSYTTLDDGSKTGMIVTTGFFRKVYYGEDK